MWYKGGIITLEENTRNTLGVHTSVKHNPLNFNLGKMFRINNYAIFKQLLFFLFFFFNIQVCSIHDKTESVEEQDHKSTFQLNFSECIFVLVPWLV